jgi:hypothetical protein
MIQFAAPRTQRLIYAPGAGARKAAVGRGDHRVQRLAPDRSVRAIREQEVAAGPGHRLSGDRGGGRAQDAVEDGALASQPLP